MAGHPVAATSSSTPQRRSASTPGGWMIRVETVSLGNVDRSTSSTLYPLRARCMAVGDPAQRARRRWRRTGGPRRMASSSQSPCSWKLTMSAPRSMSVTRMLQRTTGTHRLQRNPWSSRTRALPGLVRNSYLQDVVDLKHLLRLRRVDKRFVRALGRCYPPATTADGARQGGASGRHWSAWSPQWRTGRGLTETLAELGCGGAGR
jgi:hypothetical protein